MATRTVATSLVFEKHESFRQRIILSTLTGKSLVVKNIRSKCAEQGLRDYEIELLKMVDQVSNGARIEINESGTRFEYIPGSLHGGSFECSFGFSRPISYYLEVLFCLAPFTKHPVSASLRGITHFFDVKRKKTNARKRMKLSGAGGKIEEDENFVSYLSCDALAALSLPILRAFLGDNADKEVSLTVRKRGVLPNGGGEVHFECGTRSQLRAVRFVHESSSSDKPIRVRRVRGVAWTARVAPTASARLIDSARGVLNSCCADVYVTAQHCRGELAGKSPGFGLLLVAEYTNSSLRHAVERISLPRRVVGAEGDEDEEEAVATEVDARRREFNVPERIGEACAMDLLRAVRCGGAVDRSQQSLALTLMAFTATEVNKIETCALTPQAMDTMRSVFAFTGLKYRIETVASSKKKSSAEDEDEDSDDDSDDGSEAEDDQLLLITCIGLDYANLNRAIL